jgi:hypothetical protein
VISPSIDRYDIASWMPLKYNQDGSLDVYVQTDSPGKDKEVTGFPRQPVTSASPCAWTGRCLRCPKGSWTPPPVKRVN